MAAVQMVMTVGVAGKQEGPTHNTRCFDPFPLPAVVESRQQTIRELAERLDVHRKQVLAAHQVLTLTGLVHWARHDPAEDSAVAEICSGLNVASARVSPSSSTNSTS